MNDQAAGQAMIPPTPVIYGVQGWFPADHPAGDANTAQRGVLLHVVEAPLPAGLRADAVDELAVLLAPAGHGPAATAVRAALEGREDGGNYQSVRPPLGPFFQCRCLN